MKYEYDHKESLRYPRLDYNSLSNTANSGVEIAITLTLSPQHGQIVILTNDHNTSVPISCKPYKSI